MKKRGQGIFGMSFSTIFSIIIIIAIVVVAFFAIRHFLKINRCTQIGFFYEDFGDKIESVWTSGGADDTFTGSLPSSGILSSEITYVCFGSLLSIDSANDEDKEVGEEIIDYYNRADLESNVYMYPPEGVCIPHQEIKCRGGNSDCLTTDPSFFCVEIKTGEVTVGLEIKKGGGGPVTVKPTS